MRRKLLFLISNLILMLLMAIPARAADEWTLVHHCVTQTKERQPWEGVILFKDVIGVHGISTKYPTPYVTAFLPRSGKLLEGPGLSPDGRWYGVTIGSFKRLEGYHQRHTITAIRVYSTEDTSIVYDIDWPYSYEDNANYRQFRWLDNQHILLENHTGMVILDFVQGTTTPWESSADPLDMAFNYNLTIYPAPDVTRAIRAKSSNRINGHEYMMWEVVDMPTNTVLNTIDTPTLPEFRWTLASTQFVAEIDTTSGVQVGLFDRDGKAIDTPFTLPDNQRIFWTRWVEYRSSAWSPDERYFAFLANAPTDRTDRILGTVDKATLYIADFKTHSLIDTCNASVSVDMVWSPDSHFLALDGLTKRLTQKPTPIYLLNIQTNEMFTIAYQPAINSGLIGWRE